MHVKFINQIICMKPWQKKLKLQLLPKAEEKIQLCKKLNLDEQNHDQKEFFRLTFNLNFDI